MIYTLDMFTEFCNEINLFVTNMNNYVDGNSQTDAVFSLFIFKLSMLFSVQFARENKILKNVLVIVKDDTLYVYLKV